MICPKCNLDTLTEEKDMVVCSNCGFKATIEEYNISKHIHKANPQRRIEFHENEETYQPIDSELYKNIRDFFTDKYIQALVFVVLLVIVFLIIASM